MTETRFKLGSLFDGSGGFPLAGDICGIEPVWASEVEPYPIAVTMKQFPNMKHLGDIGRINGAEIEPVDIITFGSPCQDLSIAGKRAGLKHEDNGDDETTRSGLFMEAVRIIKEMRGATNGKYPRFALWENVPGAFSSNRGEDFRIVCEEIIKIVEPNAVMPEVPKSGWAYADSYVGDGWSLAYRVFDAQYWGVPQRRRRIYLVADLRGLCAKKILFEREGLRGYFAEGRTPWQTVTSDVERGIAADDQEAVGFDGCKGNLTGGVTDELGIYCGMLTARNGVIEREQQLDTVFAFEPGAARRLGGYVWEGIAGTLRAEMGDNQTAVAYSFDSLASNSMKSKNPHSGCHKTEVSKTLDTTIPDPGKNQGGVAIVQNLPYTLKIRSGCEGGGKGALVQEDKSATLATNNDQYLFQPMAVENHPNDSRVKIDESGKVQALTSRMGTGGGNVPMVMEPVVCLQGNGIDRADTAGCNGKGWKEDTSYTLNTIDRPAVAYGLDRASFNQGQNAKFDFTVAEEQQPTLTARGPGAVAHSIDEKCKMQTKVTDLVVQSPHYIVRRLTPTECARLQGFPDTWGHPLPKESLTDEEYAFWTDVRATKAVIEGKEAKTYSREQMLTWYNSLHTDSAEYKMWGNGIALPTALYCMQGVADALKEE